MELPAPVVTIVDPACPVLPGVPVDRPARLLRPVEQALAGGLALLLLVSALAGHRLRLDDRASHLLAAAGLRAELSTGRVALAPDRRGAVAGRAVGSVRLTAVGTQALPLVGVRADAGWVAGALPGAVLQPGVELVVGLEQGVRCDRLPRSPTRLSLTVILPGADRRTVDVPVHGTADGLRREAELLCGDLGAADALVLTGSSTLSRGAGTLLELQLANRSTAPLTVLGATYPGFGITFDDHLPVLLPGRAPGPSDGTGLDEVVLHAHVRLEACGPARAALDRAGRLRPPDLLDLRVDGRGGAAVARVDVRGLVAYLEADWQQACR